MLENTVLDYVSLGLVSMGMIATVTVFLVAHEIPYKIAKKKNHPHTEAIHAGCWFSIFTGGLMWPMMFIWCLVDDIPILMVDGKTVGQKKKEGSAEEEGQHND